MPLNPGRHRRGDLPARNCENTAGPSISRVAVAAPGRKQTRGPRLSTLMAFPESFQYHIDGTGFKTKPATWEKGSAAPMCPGVRQAVFGMLHLPSMNLSRLSITMSEYAETRLAPGLARSARPEDPPSRGPNLHGYAIVSAIKDWSGEVLHVEEGTVYPALHRMEEAGWIRTKWITKDAGRRARIYRLTVAGKRRPAAEELRWQALRVAVNRILRTV